MPKLFIHGVRERGSDHSVLAWMILCRPTLEASLSASFAVAEQIRESNHAPPQTPQELSMAEGLWRFAANALLYLSSTRADLQRVVPAGLEKEAASRKAKEIQDRIRAREGEVLALGYRLRRVRRTTIGEEPGGQAADSLGPESRAPLGLHLVGGHWKNQSYGPESSLRKLIYIMPYWRGSDGFEERIEQEDS